MTPYSNVAELTRTAQARWAKVRSGGRAIFIWRYGVVGWGLPAGTLTACYHVIHAHARGAAWSVAALRPLWESIIGLMLACGCVGYLLGAWLWDACQARFPLEPGAGEGDHPANSEAGR